MIAWLVVYVETCHKISNDSDCIDYQLLFQTKIHPQPDQHAFDRNNIHKVTMILLRLSSSFIFIFHLIVAL